MLVFEDPLNPGTLGQKTPVQKVEDMRSDDAEQAEQEDENGGEQEPEKAEVEPSED